MVFQVVSIWMILNMTVAAVIDGMQTAQDDNDRFFKSSDIDEFIDLWQLYDPEGTGLMPLKEFIFFIGELKAPFNQIEMNVEPHKRKLQRNHFELGYFINSKRKFKVR